MMGTHHSLGTTTRLDHMMGTHHSLGTTMRPDHSFRDHLLDHSLGTMRQDHIYDRD